MVSPGSNINTYSLVQRDKTSRPHQFQPLWVQYFIIYMHGCNRPKRHGFVIIRLLRYNRMPREFVQSLEIVSDDDTLVYSTNKAYNTCLVQLFLFSWNPVKPYYCWGSKSYRLWGSLWVDGRIQMLTWPSDDTRRQVGHWFHYLESEEKARLSVAVEVWTRLP